METSGTGGPTIAPQSPKRPANVVFASIRELYLEFENIFLAGAKSLITSPCGHRIYCFEHHFFHMAGIIVAGVPELSMKTEKSTILETHVGFAHYEMIEGGSRGRHLRSAYETLASPDEVWEDNPKAKTAKWVYIKEYDSKPYSFSIALAGDSHTRSTVIVPFSSFPVARKNIKKWRQGTRIHPALLIS